MKVIHPDHSLGLSMRRETLLSTELRQPTSPPLYSFIACMKVIHPDHSLGLSMRRETLLSTELRQPTSPPLYSFIALFAIDTE